MTKVTITLQDGEFIARHSDHVGIIGVGDTEQEALQELAEALGALAFRVNMKDELLRLYRKKDIYGRTIGANEVYLKICDDIKALEKELKEELE